MAKYTIELRKVCEYFNRSEVEGWFKDYELFDFLTPLQIQTIESHGVWNKDKLAKKIVDHYWMREIGLETPALFAHYAKVKMNEIMESKLPLIYSAAIEYDPLVNVDYTETFNRNIAREGSVSNILNSDSSGSSSSNSSNSINSSTSGSSNSSSTQNSSSYDINNETPQTLITKQNLDSGIYASSTNQNDVSTSISDSTSNSSTSNSSSSGTVGASNSSSLETTSNSQDEQNTNESYTKKVKGNSGVSATAQKMIVQYRENIIAIDKDIIEELDSLFMGLY